MRLFIAVETGEDLRLAAASAMRRLKTAGADVKWVRPEQMHFTLHFLGAVAPARAPLAARAVEAASGVRAFPLELSGAGAFPDAGNPRVIWLGLSRGAAELAALRKAVGEELSASGFELDSRPFAAHLTLGRVRGTAGMDNLRKLLQEQKTAGPAPACFASAVTLFESRLSPSGPEYEVVRSVALKSV